MTMTPADLKIRREALGLSQEWIARNFGVQDRAVRRWEAGDSPIPHDLERLLDGLEKLSNDYVDRLLITVSELANENGDPAGIELRAYVTDESLYQADEGFKPMPASWHRVLLARVRAALDVPVRFDFPPK